MGVRHNRVDRKEAGHDDRSNAMLAIRRRPPDGTAATHELETLIEDRR
jgi:hypothetical protein